MDEPVSGELYELADVLSDDAFLDECAMRAMGAIITNGWQQELWLREQEAGKHRAERTCSIEADTAQVAYSFADAMLGERKRRRNAVAHLRTTVGENGE